MRLGLFGGSFDPVHNGHLRLAECCADQAALDEVWFVPAALQPHKPDGPVASDADRVAMLRLAVGGEPRFAVSTIEIDRGGVSYTFETLQRIAQDRPDDELFFLMGADTLHDLPNWRDPAEVLRLATPLVVCRPGEPSPDTSLLATLVTAERLEQIERSRVEMPPMDVSSSELRQRLAGGDSCEGSLPPAVARYAQNNWIYAGPA